MSDENLSVIWEGNCRMREPDGTPIEGEGHRVIRAVYSQRVKKTSFEMSMGLDAMNNVRWDEYRNAPPEFCTYAANAIKGRDVLSQENDELEGKIDLLEQKIKHMTEAIKGRLTAEAVAQVMSEVEAKGKASVDETPGDEIPF